MPALLKSRRRIFENPLAFGLYILPGLSAFGLFVLVPVIGNVVLSFQEWDGINPPVFVGLANFAKMLKDPAFYKAFRNNAVLVVYMTLLPTAVGLGLATLLRRSIGRGRRFFEFLFFTPQILSMTVVGVIWRWIYNPAFGVLNGLLDLAGLEALKASWLGDPRLALSSVGLTGTWVAYGFAMVVYLAGYTRIPESLYESASLDGAGAWKQFLHISLPSLVRESSVILVYLFITTFKTFDLIFLMTRGGPGDETMVLSLLVFKKAFQYNRLGEAAANALVLAVIVFAISVLSTRRRYRGDAA